MSIWVVVRGLVRSSLWVAGVVAPQAWWGKAAVVVDIVDVVDILIWWSRRKTWWCFVGSGLADGGIFPCTGYDIFYVSNRLILAVALRCMPLALFQGLAIGNVGCRMRLAVVLLIQD